MSAVISDNPGDDRTMHGVRRASGMPADQSPNDHLEQSRGRTPNSRSLAPTRLRLPTQPNVENQTLNTIQTEGQIPLNNGPPQPYVPRPNSTPGHAQHGGQRAANDNTRYQRKRSNRKTRIPRPAQAKLPNKSMRGTLKVATLNVKGAGGRTISPKWQQINNLLKTETIGVLAVQETHSLNEETLDYLNSVKGYRMHIFHSGDPTQPNSKGIAIVLNKHLTRWQEASTKTLIPGRATLMILPWHGDSKLHIAAVYAPNSEGENARFWEDLRKMWVEQHLPMPDIVLGDFNMVEEAIDREPAHNSNGNVINMFENLKIALGVIDAWRQDNPTTEEFTYFQLPDRLRKSRLDRIYTTNSLRQRAFEWRTDDSGIATADHLLVSVRISDPGAPHIGKGRWSIPIHLLQDQEVSSLLNKSGSELLRNMENAIEQRTTEVNPQTLFRDWKDDSIKKIRDMARKKIPQIEQRLTRIKEQVKEIREDPTIPIDDKQCLTAELATESARLAHLRYEKTRDNLDARRWVYRETITKPWMIENKDKKQRDPIKMLKVPGSNPPQYQRGSKEMLDIARKHHVDLQNHDLPADEETHINQITDILQSLPKKIPSNEKAKLATEISQDEILSAIHALPNGKSPGLDGVPHEFWKTLLDRYITETANPNGRSDDTAFNVAQALKILFNDIEKFGLTPESNFAEGWMCPIFKKKDRTDIANYRPITVLNADYKILTRVLAMRLADAVPEIIHKDQAGFMRGRHIEDHTDLANYMIHRCKLDDENGAIVFLDQEKAYDKILHPFIWESLKTFDFPDRFTNTVKTLYGTAYTTIIINGEKAEPFKVTRGVRQGDPMSCLLFNIAIESLANALRKSELKGFTTKGEAERLVVTLFADDTTVYLSENNSFEDLQAVLEEWCKASGAKFNVNKTEILPIGSKEHRQRVCQTRKLNPDDAQISPTIRIVRDGEHTRTLGAYVGNEINEITVWTPVLDRIDDELEKGTTTALHRKEDGSS